MIHVNIQETFLSSFLSMHHQEKLEHHVYELTCYRVILFFYSLLNSLSFSVWNSRSIQSLHLGGQVFLALQKSWSLRIANIWNLLDKYVSHESYFIYIYIYIYRNKKLAPISKSLSISLLCNTIKKILTINIFILIPASIKREREKKYSLEFTRRETQRVME